jgi:hypothetical protein
VAFLASQRTNRRQYLVAGLLGGLAGEFSGVASLLLSLWFGCRSQGQSCNTAQGDIGLIFTAPMGAMLGCVFAMWWTYATLKRSPSNPWASVFRYSGQERFKNCAFAIATPFALWVLVTVVVARLMA